LGVLVVSLIGFLFRLIAVPFFQKATLWLIVFGALGLVLIVLSFILRHSKALLWFGLGSLAYAVIIFGLRLIKLDDNLMLFIISLIAGLILLIWGIIKRG
jgi:hypothetical protein